MARATVVASPIFSKLEPHRILTGLLVAGAAVALAACGSSPPPTPTGTQVGTAASPYGNILVTSTNHTLYAFSADTATSSKCNGSCNQLWIPLGTVNRPQAMSGADASLLAVLTRSDGTKQVVYAGHPLYTYVGDSSPGQTRGQGIAGAWHVVSASGQVITAGSSSSTTSSSPSTTRPTTTTTAPTTTTTRATTTTTTSTTTTTTP